MALGEEGFSLVSGCDMDSMVGRVSRRQVLLVHVLLPHRCCDLQVPSM